MMPEGEIHARGNAFKRAVRLPPALSDLLRNRLQLLPSLRNQLLILQPQNRQPKDYSNRIWHVRDRTYQLRVVDAPSQRLGVIRNRSEVFQQLPFLHDNVGTPARGVDHAKENRLLDIGGVFDTVGGGGPINTQPPHSIGLHDRIRSAESSVADERKEEQSGLAKLERLVVLVRVTDTANERGICRVEVLEGLDGVGTKA
ncbi:hypothetical protein BDM02DRAFT_1315835 [Thelephora ganbajun]|uniref:Uncharacterized protein n=1 Tax=Thelephora ganbajun TaxID=370292 RepID=A0ACB6Z2I6_THEGA|nr:hypothetical protein BDM02DRAFT_1315835 [Thelephora ganbajun]